MYFRFGEQRMRLWTKDSWTSNSHGGELPACRSDSAATCPADQREARAPNDFTYQSFNLMSHVNLYSVIQNYLHHIADGKAPPPLAEETTVGKCGL